MVLGSGNGSDPLLLSQDLLSGSSSFSKLGAGKRTMVDDNFVNGVLNVDGVKKCRLEGGMLSPIVADLVLSAGTAC